MTRRPAAHAVGPGPSHPLAHGALGHTQVAGHGPDALALVEYEADGLGFEVVIELPALGVCVIGRDIVSAFRKMSTYSD